MILHVKVCNPCIELNVWDLRATIFNKVVDHLIQRDASGTSHAHWESPQPVKGDKSVI